MAENAFEKSLKLTIYMYKIVKEKNKLHEVTGTRQSIICKAYNCSPKLSLLWEDNFGKITVANFLATVKI